ncbi:hypothetical protein [Streptomyces sp. CS014]|uniref:hypothetical protein n=1 Tax=Streptomyces sp. CS014 TaxID=2162707 RepID=UPI000D51C918|nr:hypothetical protein [Streptomyces sp. CS014]PVD01353.1 hypothetical protein DBP12_07495 [Streptomyces sp. CS014]
MTFAPRLWMAGETVTAAMLNTEIRDQFNSMFDAWTAFTPTWTSTGTAPTLGNGTLTGRYMKIGRTVHVYGALTFGSTTNTGTGSLTMGLPVQAASASPGVLSITCSRTGSQNFLLGASPISNNATSLGTMWLANPSTIGDWNSWTDGAPTLAAGDIMRYYGTYQAAT